MVEADAVTACSAQTLVDAEQFTGIDLGDRGSVIPGGVDVERFSTAQPENRARPYLLGAGRHVNVKGFDTLIGAYRLVLDQLPGAPDLVIAGDGEERPKLEMLAAAREISDRVEFVGQYDRSDIARLFKGCTLFVLPSRAEGLPLVSLEAMAAGKPVVATRVGGIPEVVIDGVTGLLVSPDDPVGLADSICRLLENPILAKQVASAGRRQVSSFDWQSIAERYDSLYEDACARAADRMSS